MFRQFEVKDDQVENVLRTENIFIQFIIFQHQIHNCVFDTSFTLHVGNVTNCRLATSIMFVYVLSAKTKR